MKRRIRWGRLAAVLLLAAALMLPALSMAAFADEGDLPGISAEGPEPGGDIPPDPPPTDDPVSTPPEPPVSEPEPPSSEPPTSEPGDDPSPEGPAWGGNDDPYDEPATEPPEESEAPPGAVVNPNPTPRRSSGASISRPNLGRPALTLNSGSSSAPSSGGDGDSLTPNYITFARLDPKANSMSITLFYGGAGCVLFGVLGLVFLLALFIHNRRNRYIDDRDGIFEEIAQAESRSPARTAPQPPAPAEPPTTQKPTPPPPQIPPEQPPYYDPAPPQDNLYTEEFELPQQEPIYYNDYSAPEQDSLYTEEFELPQEGYTPPAQDSLYTEEFQLPQPPAPYKPPTYSSQPAPPPQAEHNPYDTDEILRELLGKDK